MQGGFLLENLAAFQDGNRTTVLEALVDLVDADGKRWAIGFSRGIFVRQQQYRCLRVDQAEEMVDVARAQFVGEGDERGAIVNRGDVSRISRESAKKSPHHSATAFPS